MSDRKFLDSAGLSTFLNNLKTAYANNDTNAYSAFIVGQAGKLATARTIGLSGDVSGTATSFDGSQNITITTTIADVVASTSGEGGSHGLMTAAQAEKLAGVADGAQVNVLEGVQIKNNGDSDFSDLTISSKKVQIDLSGYAKKTDIAAALNFKGAETGANLTAMTVSDVSNGDVYTCTSDDGSFHAGYEYAAVVSGSSLSWVELGKYLDLSGYALKTREINGHSLENDITLDGSDIALSSNYAVASTAAAPAAGDSIDTAVGKLQKEVADANAAATTYAFAEGSTDGAFQVTPTVGGVAGSAQSVAIHGLGSAAYAATTDFVSSTLTPAEAGAEVNDIVEIKFKGQGDSSASALTIDGNRAVTIDVSAYEKSANLGTAAYTSADAYVSSTLAPAEAGAQVNDIEIVKFKGNGDGSASALTIDSSDKSVTIDVSGYALTSDLSSFISLTALSTTDSASGDYVTGVSYNNASGVFTVAKASKGAIADSDTGLVDGDTVYDYIEALPISTSEINSLFGISG